MLQKQQILNTWPDNDIFDDEWDEDDFDEMEEVDPPQEERIYGDEDGHW